MERDLRGPGHDDGFPPSRPVSDDDPAYLKVASRYVRRFDRLRTPGQPDSRNYRLYKADLDANRDLSGAEHGESVSGASPTRTTSEGEASAGGPADPPRGTHPSVDVSGNPHRNPHTIPSKRSATGYPGGSRVRPEYPYPGDAGTMPGVRGGVGARERPPFFPHDTGYGRHEATPTDWGWQESRHHSRGSRSSFATRGGAFAFGARDDDRSDLADDHFSSGSSGMDSRWNVPSSHGEQEPQGWHFGFEDRRHGERYPSAHELHRHASGRVHPEEDTQGGWGGGESLGEMPNTTFCMFVALRYRAVKVFISDLKLPVVVFTDAEMLTRL